MRTLGLGLLTSLIVIAGSARADDANGCGKFKWSIERERAAFAAPGLPVIASGATLAGLSAASTIALLPQDQVSFARPPGRKPKADPAFAAVVTLPAVTASGTYTVTLSDEAWIDVVQDGKEIRSAGFSGQPDCPGVRKTVRFPLGPGAVTLQISGAAVRTLNIDVLPAP